MHPSTPCWMYFSCFFQAEDGIRDPLVTGVQTCALPIYLWRENPKASWAGSPCKRPSLPGELRPKIEMLFRLPFRILSRTLELLHKTAKSGTYSSINYWGRTGFDSSLEAQAACRGWFVGLVKNRTKKIKADNEGLALAA